MSPKQKKPKSRDSSPGINRKIKGGKQKNALLISIFYGVLGAVVFYFLHPVLNYKSTLSGSLYLLMTFFSAAIGAFGTTGFFQRNTARIALFTLPLLVMQIVTSVLITYGWAAGGILEFLSGTMSLPLAILWYFILKYNSIDTVAESASGTYSLSSVFSGRYTKIMAAMILLVAGVLFFYRLGYFDIWEDENLVINAAKGVYEEGFAYLHDGYNRAWLHTIICAGVFKLFGISEFTGRIPSAVFGVLFVVLCFIIYARWYGMAWLALLIPIVCLMNDRFLILFRYMRMYALLIPLFLAGTYIIYRALQFIQAPRPVDPNEKYRYGQWAFVIAAVLFMPLLAHIHKLSMVLLPVIGIFVLYTVLLERTKNQMRLLWIIVASGVVLLFLTFVVQLDKLNMFRQVAGRIFSPHTPMPAYFEYVLGNGLPLNSTLMFLVAGLGLLTSGISKHLKSLIVLNYLLIIIPLVSMVYLVEGEGRDYRYISHIVPFVVCALLLAVHYAGKVLWKGSYPRAMVFVFLVSTLQLFQGYTKVYIRHPWAPSYTVVYASLLDQYKPGDALFVQNVKTYYLDGATLAGSHYHKVPKRREYTMEQFLSDIKSEGHGWFMWEWHKAHNWRRDILEYIYRNFKPIHNSNMDDLGVELFYFDETMIQ